MKYNLLKNNDQTINLGNQGTSQILEFFSNTEISKKVYIEDGFIGTYGIVLLSSQIKIEIIAEKKNTKANIVVFMPTGTGHKNKIDIQGIIKSDLNHIQIDILTLGADSSEIDVIGGISILENTKGSQGYLSENNLILGNKIKLKTLPLLDVRTNDVKAGHGAKVSRIDEKGLFYLQSKGLTPKIAKNLIIEGMINNLMKEFIDLDEFKEIYRESLEEIEL